MNVETELNNWAVFTLPTDDQIQSDIEHRIYLLIRREQWMIDRSRLADGNIVGGIDMLDSRGQLRLILIVSRNLQFIAYPIQSSATFATPIFFHSFAGTAIECGTTRDSFTKL